MRKYKDTAMQNQYETFMRLARDHTSSFYLPDGSPNRGASHNDAFWRGYFFGNRAKYARGTAQHLAVIAGRDYARETGLR